VEASVLSDGQWQLASGSIPLFRLADSSKAPLGIARRTHLDCANAVSLSHPRRAGESSQFTPSSRDGFFRFTLTDPAGAFGHQEYPGLLTAALARNARLKHERLQRPLPNAPFAPRISSISVDYVASAAVGADDEGAIFHLHPFGWDRLDRLERIPLLPPHPFRACLLIGLQARRLPETLSLLFRMEGDGGSPSEDREPLRWSLLGAQGWEPLEGAAILRDGTCGLRTTGILRMSLPPSREAASPLMPGGLHWLRVEAADDPCRADLLAVHAQCLEARWRPSPGQSREVLSLPAGSIRGLRHPIAGIAGVQQHGETFGGRIPESALEWRARLSGRLRHRGRALSVDDIEELVLQEFPEVGRVKAFPGRCFGDSEGLHPGKVLVVPVPRQLDLDAEPAGLTGPRLQAIAEFLRSRSCQGSGIEVANPLWDKIVVRCRLLLKEGREGDRQEELLVKGIREFIFPWAKGGNAKHFGWHLRQRDVEAFLLGYPFVKGVQAFSFLRISDEPAAGKALLAPDSPASRRSLLDTARLMQEDGASLRPRYPWSVAHPAAFHRLFLPPRGEEGPVPVGIGELGVGSTFIVVSAEDPWERKAASN
jgi:hypothetical protein